MTIVYGIGTTNEGKPMHATTDTLKRFYAADGALAVFEASAKRLNCGDWLFRYAGDTVSKLSDDGATEGIAELLEQAATQGGLDRVRKVLVSPVIMVMLYGEQTVTWRHFARATGSSLGYFDLPEIEFNGFAMPIRVAQVPARAYALTDRRGMPAVW